MKAAGFEGVEGRVIPVPQAAKMREVADKLGMRIHSVLYGWAEFNSPDKARSQRTFDESAGRAADGAGLRRRHRPARALSHRRRRPRPGAIAKGPVLRMPRPWEFQIEFDPSQRPLLEGGPRRQRALRRLHRGPQPRHRHVARVGEPPDPDRREDQASSSRSRTSATTCGSRRRPSGTSSPSFRSPG